MLIKSKRLFCQVLSSKNIFFKEKLTNFVKYISTTNKFQSNFDKKYDKMDEYTKELAIGILERKRISLARAITLVESSNTSHQHQADFLLNFLTEWRYKNGFKPTDTLRIGVAGPPGSN